MNTDPPPFETTAAALAAAAGLTLTIRPGKTDFGGAMAFTHEIRYGPGIAKQPAVVQEWVAAHEVAHIALGHRGLLRNTGGMLMIVVAVTLLLTLVMEQTQNRLLGEITMWAAMIATALTVVYGLIRTRQEERAADQQACLWGYHLTQDVRRWMLSAQSSLTNSTWFKPFAIHDHPDRRHQACIDNQ